MRWGRLRGWRRDSDKGGQDAPAAGLLSLTRPAAEAPAAENQITGNSDGSEAMSRNNRDTEQEKHQSGGPGKAAKSAHVDPDKAGNKPEQNQSGSAGRERGAGSGGSRGASEETRRRSS